MRDLNEYMDQESRSAPARYGVILDASLITGIDPPPEVESALAAINTAHNQVSSDISLAQAAAVAGALSDTRAVDEGASKAQAASDGTSSRIIAFPPCRLLSSSALSIKLHRRMFSRSWMDSCTATSSPLAC